MKCRLAMLLVAAWLSAAPIPPIAADEPKTNPPANQLQTVLERIHQHAAGGAGQTESLRDDQIEGWLDNLLASIAKAANLPDLKVPVRLADVKLAEGPQQGTVSGALIVGKDIKAGALTTLRKCFVLADGNVLADRVEDCVIVARGAVDVRFTSQNCVIVAGAFAKVSRDGGNPGSAPAGSVIVSRGWADVRSAIGSIIAAPEGATVGSSQNALFVNATFAGRDRGGSKTLKVPDLPLEAMPVHPFVGLVRVQGVLCIDGTPPGQMLFRPGTPFTPQQLGVVFQFEGRRYVAESGQPIVDEAGEPVQKLKSWKLTYFTDSLAIFSDGNADAVVKIGEK